MYEIAFSTYVKFFSTCLSSGRSPIPGTSGADCSTYFVILRVDSKSYSQNMWVPICNNINIVYLITFVINYTSLHRPVNPSKLNN